MKHILCFWHLVMFILLAAGTSAQSLKSDRLKPQWIHRPPVAKVNTLEYIVDVAVGNSLDEARTASINGVIASAGFQSGMLVRSDYRTETIDKKVWKDGKPVDYTSDTFVVSSDISGKDVQLYIKDIDEYWAYTKDGNVQLTKLYAKSISEKFSGFENLEVTTKYGAKGLWRSAIIPGWGQFHKGDNLKGTLFLGGTAACAVGIIITEAQRSDYNRRLTQTHDINQIKNYQTKRDNAATARNVCIGAAGALYVYNLIDAMVAPGARRIVQTKNRKSYSFAPSLAMGNVPCMSASMIF